MTQYNKTYADVVAEHEQGEMEWLMATWEYRYEIDPKRAFTDLVSYVQELNDQIGELKEELG